MGLILVPRILSILFGRFGFSCDTAMIEYTNIAQAFSSTKEDGSFDESKLKEAIQMLSEKYVGDRNALLLDEKRESKVYDNPSSLSYLTLVLGLYVAQILLEIIFGNFIRIL